VRIVDRGGMSDLTELQQLVAAFDAGDPGVTIDQYDDAVEQLAAAGLL
jgi:hypothetical protein